MKRFSKLAITLGAVAVVVLCALPLRAAELATVEAAGTTVIFTPQRPAHAWSLRVGAPDGQVHARKFAGGDVPSFTAVDEHGALMPDGAYTWELITLPAPRRRGSGDGPAIAGGSQSGGFLMRDGAVIAGGEEVATKDLVINDDLIVFGSACIGLDCINGESFGLDTLRLKEKNLRIDFFDTSRGSFPSNDWKLVANDDTFGGRNRFSIEDASAGSVPFTVEAGAPSDALYVDDRGAVGFGTAVPSQHLHVKDGDTPTLRLQQDSSASFAAQTWDIAGNEANLFIRDVNANTLPFRIRPGASDDAVVIANDGDVGIGTASPAPGAQLHVRQTDGTTRVLIQEVSATVDNSRVLMEISNNGEATVRLRNATRPNVWDFKHNAGGGFVINDVTTGGTELVLLSNGDLTIRGSLTTAMSSLPDYVFEPEYELMPLDELERFIAERKHLPKIPSAEAVAAAGNRVDMTELQRLLLEKVEELTLYTLEQQARIRTLEARLDAQAASEETAAR